MTTRIHTLLVVATVLLATVSPASAALGSDPAPEIQQHHGQPSVIVELDENATASIRSWANASADRHVIRVSDTANTATVAAPRWQLDAGLLERLSEGHILVNQLSERSYVNAIHPNYVLSYAEPVTLSSGGDFEQRTIESFKFNDPAFPTDGVAFSEQSNRSNMSDVRAYTGSDNVSADTSGMVIAVSDTGARTAAGRIFGNGSTGSPIRIHNASKSFLSNESVNVPAGNFSAIKDENGHGTWTGAALAGNPNGTTHDAPAKNATVLVLKALADDGSGSTSDIAASIRYAAAHNATLLSLSLGSPIRSAPIVDAMADAHDKGTVVVVAAGNSRATRSPGVATPADVDSAITVGATNGSEPPSAWSASFSQTGGTQPSDGTLSPNGEAVDVVAPGMQVATKVPTLNGGQSTETSVLSGTSMATPIVGSAIVEAMAANATLNQSSPTAIHDAVTASARPTPHLAVVEAGHGMIATDNLATGEHPTTSQSGAMTTAAADRQQWYEAASAARGGVLARILNREAS